jgi:predicted transcriptional regulator
MLESLDLKTVSAIRGTTGADERTIRRFLRGERVKGEVLRARLTEAARTIGAQIQPIQGATMAA